MQPGCLALHGNRLEDLSGAVLSWLQRHPLPGLTPEAVLVQSNGMAEWFKMTAAQHLGVCAAMQVELPARFVWRTYRQLLGRAVGGEADAPFDDPAPARDHPGADDDSPLPVPSQLPLDKEPLVWRLMAGLAQRAAVVAQGADADADADADAHADAPVDPADADAARAWSVTPLHQPAAQQLAWAQRVADLFDQYQVYRPDWLVDWQAGRDVLRHAPEEPASAAPAVPPDLAWQPALWRQVVRALNPGQQRLTRPALHREALRRLRQWPAGQPIPGLPPRLVLFGTTQLPLQTLELLAALARHIPVLMAVPNPCRYDWVHLGVDARTDGHPLLATWGRQSRDFIRHLDRFDEVQRRREAFDMPRVDLFSEGPGDTLLAQLQADIRDMTPLSERRAQALARPPAADRSVQFHVAHSALREVEVLHDQLLHHLAQPAPPGGAALQPRDIVVMVPDVETFAPAIRAVFGQYGRGDARHIPWGIADVNERGELPLLQAVGWLLQAEQHRFTASELQDLLALPALTARLGLSDTEAAELGQWVAQAGLRWGLDAAQRAQALSTGECDESAEPGESTTAATPDLHTWRWALDRLLWGYAGGEAAIGATGDTADVWPDLWQGLLPVPHIGGLGAALLGPFEALLERLRAWCGRAQQQLTPAEWAMQARQLLDDLFLPQTDRERDALAALDDALSRWLSHAEAAGFAEPVPLAVLRDAWLRLLQPAGLQQRFKAGGVTFCTLLPMRAVPFEMVCLLGMNDGSYPRSQPPSPLDLMQSPGQARAGDRSRRDDDRQLMLDAVLAARRLLYVSWVGRSVRDNTVCEPSVLVAQLRDHLDAGWGEKVCAERTTEHPLQPFSRRCFEQPSDGVPAPWFTHAHEWRSLHETRPLPAGRAPGATQTAARQAPAAASASEGRPHTPGEERWRLDTLARWLQNPPRQWLRGRVGVWLDTGLTDSDDDEPFGLGPLTRHELLLALSAWPLERLRTHGPALLARSGALPWGGAGSQAAEALLAQAADLRQRFEARLALGLYERPPLEIDAVVPPFGADGLAVWLSDAVTGLWALRAEGATTEAPTRASHAADTDGTHCTHDSPQALRVVITASSLFQGKGSARALRADKLIGGWVQALACAAAGCSVRWEWVAPDATLSLQLPTEGAAQRLSELLQACQQARHAPRPPAALPRSALALLADQAEAARRVFEGKADDSGPEAMPGATARGPRPEVADPAVQRCFPGFDALQAAPGHREAVEQLYGALAHDLQRLVQIWPAADDTARQSPARERARG